MSLSVHGLEAYCRFTGWKPVLRDELEAHPTWKLIPLGSSSHLEALSHLEAYPTIRQPFIVRIPSGGEERCRRTLRPRGVQGTLKLCGHIHM